MNNKVLIVDDETSVRLLLEEALESLEEEKIEILIAKNGEEALKIIQTEKPKLVFLDVIMPKMSGIEVCDTVKNKLEMPDVYIIMLTANGQEVDKQQGCEAGADLYMTKPFRSRNVLKISREVLGLSAISE
ncbi:response regulator [Nostoc sp. 106C]|uniref:response regulator n=1 Tax=Nostoc sp. 106C TaxID=1932667 RepID=UPI000A3BB705|nr:response regulator [Nostoc sp. 106C]OUL18366.1 two-component system response regulator [Nostoc sp. RF31YmG]OUL19090.1 two-component system response regulator [Nostoc sp. 106C]